jgi:hypothetical protein
VLPGEDISHPCFDNYHPISRMCGLYNKAATYFNQKMSQCISIFMRIGYHWLTAEIGQA